MFYIAYLPLQIYMLFIVHSFHYRGIHGHFDSRDNVVVELEGQFPNGNLIVLFLINGERASENYLIQRNLRSPDSSNRRRRRQSYSARRVAGTCPISKVEIIPQKWTFGMIHMRNRHPEQIKISEGLPLKEFIRTLNENKSMQLRRFQFVISNQEKHGNYQAHFDVHSI